MMDVMVEKMQNVFQNLKVITAHFSTNAEILTMTSSNIQNMFPL